MKELIEIISIAIVQGICFDFLIYFGILEENEIKAEANLYWLWKVIFDFPVSILFMLYVLHMSYNIIIIFYFLKWLGLCDAIYILFWYIIRNEAYSKLCFWFFFTPLGNIRTIQVYFYHNEIKDILKKNLGSNWWKGQLELKEFWKQNLIGLSIAIIIIITKFSPKGVLWTIINFIINLFTK